MDPAQSPYDEAFKERLGKFGIKVSDVEELAESDVTAFKGLRGGMRLPLYREENLVLLSYALRYDEEVQATYNEKGLIHARRIAMNARSLQEVHEKLSLLDALDEITSIEWSEDPARLSDRNYLGDRALKIERATQRHSVRTIERICARPLEAIASVEEGEPPRITVTYRFK